MDEIIAPHQTTLLKLLDSYLHSAHSPTALVGMCPMLTACFFELCTFSTQTVRKSIGTGSVDNAVVLSGDLSGHGAFDLLLPKACEALVLVTQCLVSAMLELEEDHIRKNSKDGLSLLIRGAVSPHGQDIGVCAIGKSILNLTGPLTGILRQNCCGFWMFFSRESISGSRSHLPRLPKVFLGPPIRRGSHMSNVILCVCWAFCATKTGPYKILFVIVRVSL